MAERQITIDEACIINRLSDSLSNMSAARTAQEFQQAREDYETSIDRLIATARPFPNLAGLLRESGRKRPPVGFQMKLSGEGETSWYRCDGKPFDLGNGVFVHRLVKARDETITALATDASWFDRVSNRSAAPRDLTAEGADLPTLGDTLADQGRPE